MDNEIIILKMTRTENKKLGMVKAVKDATGLGLKEAKNICDKLCDNFKLGYSGECQLILKPGGNPRLIEDKLREALSECTGCYEVLGRQWDRQIKLLSLGIGDSLDYNNFISEYLSYKFIGKDIQYIQLEVVKLLEGVDSIQVEKMFNNLTKNSEK
jgi:hypothetical protein